MSGRPLQSQRHPLQNSNRSLRSICCQYTATRKKKLGKKRCKSIAIAFVLFNSRPPLPLYSRQTKKKRSLKVGKCLTLFLHDESFYTVEPPPPHLFLNEIAGFKTSALPVVSSEIRCASTMRHPPRRHRSLGFSLHTRKCMDTLFPIASFLVSSSQEAVVSRKTRWFGGGGYYRRISHMCAITKGGDITGGGGTTKDTCDHGLSGR